uniref:Hexosyltransferase n=1 Tax=Neogobius melanostomus TaxID=47308 RepID=A0A8C6S8I6_9GOBI
MCGFECVVPSVQPHVMIKSPFKHVCNPVPCLMRPRSCFHKFIEDVSEFYVSYPRSYSLLIDEPERCQQGAPFLVLVVPVSPGDRTSRDAIRDTWGGRWSASGREVQLYFLLGSIAEGNETQLDRSESRIHHDIVQGDFVDSYRNLTLKTMLMLEWLSSHCPDSAYAMKLLSTAPRRSYVSGMVQHRAEVQRDTRSKWYLPSSRILQVSARVRALYIEDVYVGLCLRELGVAPRLSHMFKAGLPGFLIPRCYWTDIITTIMRDSEQLLETWETYQKQLGSVRELGFC